DRRTKVERYYHQMELGTLPAEGVSDRVLDALSKLIGTTVSELREAGAPLGGGLGAGAPAAAFTRLAPTGEPLNVAVGEALRSDEEEWDEVDELFRGAE